MALKPDILWAQRPDSVYLTIDLKEVQDMKVTLENESLAFTGKVGGSLYDFTIEFFAPIEKASSKWSTKRLIEFYLKKQEDGVWPRLAKTKANWIKVDWKRWQDSDDEGEEKKGGFDLDGMGDMNFGDMSGGDEFDSDDDEEDMPDMGNPQAMPEDAAGSDPAPAAAAPPPAIAKEENELDQTD